MYYFFGFSLWKHNFIRSFFSQEEQKKIIFINSFFKGNEFRLALKKGLNKDSLVYIWGKKEFQDVESYIKENNISLFRIEDGFIRSIGLGSDLTQPYSLVIDSRGIYFDPTQESDLEYILRTTVFDENIKTRAEHLRQYFLAKKLSKYNLYQNKKLHIETDKKIILVPGQVEDDASIRFGANGMSNKELLQDVRQKNKDAFIVYKPHPDVVVGNRVGHIDEKDALLYADKVVVEVGIDSVLEIADEVHTMTSLVGFEALMRKKKVVTYGVPFYAGWGLTQDMKSIPLRRNRRLELCELVAATLILYPQYLDPLHLKKTTPEDLLDRLEEQKELYNSSLIFRYKTKFYSFITRKAQLILHLISFTK